MVFPIEYVVAFVVVWMGMTRSWDQMGRGMGLVWWWGWWLSPWGMIGVRGWWVVMGWLSLFSSLEVRGW